ncbi:MAG: hypothetical protein ACLU38_06925 [Dysosmobacter sp.]
MENQKVRKLVLSALMAALVYVATSIIQSVPIQRRESGRLLRVLALGWLLGPWYGQRRRYQLHAGGSAQRLHGHYVPGTLIIKGLDALAAALIFQSLGAGRLPYWSRRHRGGTIMVLGYFCTP